ncbi:hypothetical protein TW95_gp0774 [Pandoravirus inopinatum]|uniref:Uncharacterized protein n=1 Tax=Pandoravirus inopinatum TaxID=1605721 RepID=A0A0B5IXK6_9VIRU|nr:hypothetical protein TW95_gp0774 [Pandoravirus inopinatum]AJF97508.1 hypothetical protein [Pandoravirus inopinatum]
MYTALEQLIIDIYIRDLVSSPHEWFIAFVGVFVGVALHWNLRSQRFSTWTGACRVAVVAYLCAAIATAACLIMIMISTRPVGYKLYAVVRYLGVTLFVRISVASLINVLVGALVGWISQCVFGVVGAMVATLAKRIAPEHAE